jgi:hypothetical protein
MATFQHISRRSALAVIAISMTALLTAAPICKAGIIAPAPPAFGQKDLDQALADQTAACDNAAQKNSPSMPPEDRDQNRGPSDHLKTAIPVNQSSSSSSSSSGGGPLGIGAAFCALGTTNLSADDSLLGRLPEDHGLSLPNPPGTDLLRPPRR